MSAGAGRETGVGPETGAVLDTTDSDAPTVLWRALVRLATERLAAAGIANAASEARWIAERAGGFDAAELIVGLDEPVTVRCATFFHQMLDRRAAGEPLQYVLGRWPFRTVELMVDRRVLIPRPETEVLAGHLLDACDRLAARTVVDLGTGSGALVSAVLAERSGIEVWGTDVSEEALAVARANVAALGRRAVAGRLVAGRWFEALPDDLRGRVDVIVSNPPYVAGHEMADLPDDVRGWEPHVALTSGPTGLEDIETIVAEAPAWLTRPGVLLLELAPHQARRAERLARDAGFTAVSTWPDLAGRDRILHARR
ncbi:MAG TPA: peptide chain release factor N(5)-glutamine methyltransferase [Acidimicrobiales bacterium]|nr:peptide chain release factor N(5)-glutamine methyltransferase [Acidimicrobiales bacterium]